MSVSFSALPEWSVQLLGFCNISREKFLAIDLIFITFIVNEVEHFHMFKVLLFLLFTWTVCLCFFSCPWFVALLFYNMATNSL